MRFKEFIIFIIIFTIIYILFFVIYDYIRNKKAVQKSEESKEKLFDITSYYKFALFYGINSSINENVLKNIKNNIESNINISLSQCAKNENVSVAELITIILFLEYEDLIKKRAIIESQDCTIPLSETDDSLLLKYSILLINKFDYKTIIEKGGFNSEKEIDYLNSRKLLVGVKINDKNIEYYEGDKND
ncbi:MAG: hypothetical protein IKO78_03385 [Bacilli bacterium]|nr:hypothetical protein [Bacilli bacterium]